MNLILALVLNAGGIFVIAYFLKGVQIKSFWAALWVAIVLGLVNTFIKPIIWFLTLPITILTFGLFILVINACMLMLVDTLMDGLAIKNFGWALLYGVILSVLNLGFF